MPSQTQNSTLAQRTEEKNKQENAWEQYNSDTKFDAKDILKCLKVLAEKTFPNDDVNTAAYQEAIIQSLTETLDPGLGIRDFWKAMTEAGCKTLKIEEGHLNFYSGKTKIDITPYTQPIIFDAESDIYKERLLERKEQIKEAKRQLEELLNEIQKK
ncbi:MAG TPA: hypothetical protein P5229_00740 [Candidatus Gracilibacteria bacterium]|nr:hypothetical protein [Candidatus Gracilibacteria bacterium]